MNDQLNGQLGWTIPVYARDLLWLDTDAGAVQVEGRHGVFTLPAPAQVLTLRWGGATGPALTQLRWRADSLEWDGSVRIGGYVDALHITEIAGLPAPIVILQIGGQPLVAGVKAYLSRAERTTLPYPVPSFFDGIAEMVGESVTTWMAPEDSPVLTLAQDALVSKLRVYCFGRLATQEASWHEFFALPLALESMTLFAP